MKKSRLLEIIREEITTALTEAGLGDQITALQKQKDALEKQKAPLTKKEADLSKKIADLEKKEADAEVKSSSQLEEDQLNEMAFTLKKGLAPSEKIEPRYKKENFKKVVDLILSKVDGKKTMADVARELGVIQQKIRPVVSDLLDAGILEKGEAESKAGKDVANKPGPKAKAEPKVKAEKAPKAKAEKAEPVDSEDKEATQNIDNDEIAQSLSNVTGVADKFAALFKANTTEEAKKKMQALAKKANEGDQKAKAFFNNKKYSKIIKDYMSKKQVNV